ncbi:hypothetical protein BS47DRAFT_1481398 [Hydnum rufescens UP504]|uniref:tRNA isopentenyltransferase n=1 Tax=Hydnum rufescens UP504 TaxID=1448309 RepID=A0A9P6DZL2_9AGAM|nr:hypothetical protein BS47DRAFT_1481398 [Hydnum rufescens UP504]
MSTHPLIAVIGTTGVGKSRLAVDLAQALSSGLHHWKRGRVLNADAMQVYQGLDIITNKISEEEKCGIEHCLMAFKEPGNEYVVGEWINDATSLIEKSHKEQVLPIVAGGTLYWVQHLIFPDRLASNLSVNLQGLSPNEYPTPSNTLHAALSTLPDNLATIYSALPDRGSVSSLSEQEAFELHSLLSHIDPDMGSRWHWRDSRKILRSLEITKETGLRASEVVNLQDSQPSLPRFRTLIFWIYADREKLEPRLDDRVDTMLTSGLISELIHLRRIASKLPSTEQKPDFTQGIFQAIGYKEFSAYLSQLPPEDPTPSSIPWTSPSFIAGLESMKLSTKQYAKKQIKWINNRLIPAVNASSLLYMRKRGASGEVAELAQTGAQLYLLDATELGDAWETNVRDVAVSIMNKFLNDEEMPNPLTTSDAARRMLNVETTSLRPTEVLQARRKRICMVCTTDPARPMMLEEGREWEIHIKTRAHRNRDGRDKHMEDIKRRREEALLRAAQRTEVTVSSGDALG